MNQQTSSKQKPMSKLALNVMLLMMFIRKRFRNINEEISLAGLKPGNVALDYGWVLD